MPAAQRGWRVYARDGHLIGQVDAVFADYLLVRTAGLLPVDLYVPTTAILAARNGRLSVDAAADQAYARWHRPLKRAPHG
jgi:hypothetical protein